MKYLKRVFEGKEQSDMDELQDFCEMYLAYLIDDGFEVSVSSINIFKKTFSIIIKTELSKEVSWDNIKDKFIPFLQMLNKNYNLGVFPNQNFNFHESWLNKSVTFSIKEETRRKSINLTEIIEDKPTYGYPRPGKYLRGITSIEIVVHPKD